MRELERNFAAIPPESTAALKRVAVVGRGRLGSALASALRAAGYDVPYPTGRGERPAAGSDAVILCVPDAEIASAAVTAAGAAPLIGHTSGATPLAALHPAGPGAEHFGLHPLQTVAGRDTEFGGCGCAVAGSTEGALAAAGRIAQSLGMVPFEVQDEQRAAYHAAASISSNFLVTLQSEAEQLATDAGIAGFDARRMLAPLVRTTVENWARLGPERALTGPIARGDHATVLRQRDAVERHRPELAPLFDAFVERTEALVARA